MLFKTESTYILGKGFTLKHFIKDSDVNVEMRKAYNLMLLGFKCTKKLFEESKSGTNAH